MKQYSQIDKEALAIIWAVLLLQLIHHFTLVTNHKPLTQILHPETNEFGDDT